MAKALLRVFCLLTALCLLPLPGLAEDGFSLEYPGYQQVAESDEYLMYLYEPTLSILLKNKRTGAVLESTLSDKNDNGKNKKAWKGYLRSGLVLSVIQDSNNTYQADLINNPHTLQYAYTPQGFSVDVYFEDYGLGLSMEVALTGDEMTVRIPDASIREDREGVYIATVSPFPLLGYTYLGQQEGYMLLPDGNGALIRLNDKEGRFSSGFSQMIYGSDSGFSESAVKNYLWDRYETVINARQVLCPIFGMAHTDDEIAFLGIVESGEKRCSIEAHPNGVMVDYNRCFAKFLLRDIYQQPLNQSNSGSVKVVESGRIHHDLAVRYCLLSGEKANYVGMAVKYREYLLATGKITARDTAYRTRVDFLGSDREKFLVNTTPVVMTTAEDIQEIYADLQSQGIKSLLSVYKGWQKGGVNALPFGGYDADSAVGGGEQLKKTAAEAEKSNYILSLYDEALRMNATTNTFTYDAMKMVNKRTFKEENSRPVYNLFYYLLPAKSGERLESVARALKQNGFSSLSLGGVTNTLFSYSLKGAYYTRNDCAQAYEAAVREAAGGLKLALEEPFQYLWPFMDAFLDMPLNSSDYMYVDEEIPFLSIVLKGVVPMYSDYVNFEANKTEFFLQMVESGVYPSFYVTKNNSSALIYTNSSDLYSTQYAAYRDTILSYDRELRALAEITAGAVITNHEKLENGVRRVTYSNGAVIYVNYTGAEAQADGVTIGAFSYKAGEKQ